MSSDPVMADLERYLSAQEKALDEEEQRELERLAEIKSDIFSILNAPIEVSDKLDRLVSLVEFEIQEARNEAY
jgi:succinate dehydrogenase flavin-adding protein (antitoxin of CptAB toxin-antitoxin module)